MNTFITFDITSGSKKFLNCVLIVVIICVYTRQTCILGKRKHISLFAYSFAIHTLHVSHLSTPRSTNMAPNVVLLTMRPAHVKSICFFSTRERSISCGTCQHACGLYAYHLLHSKFYVLSPV